MCTFFCWHHPACHMKKEREIQDKLPLGTYVTLQRFGVIISIQLKLDQKIC